MRAFPISLVWCGRYWTVVDDDYRVVSSADGYLRHLRLGQDAAESTTKAYAEAVALYLRWCELTARDWRTAVDRLGGFITWLKHTPSDPDAPAAGPGVPPVRGPGRINRILTVVRGFLRHGVALGEVPSEVLAVLYDVSDDRHLPDEVRGENPALRYVARPRHRLSETERVIDRATDDEVLALLRACRSARDRFIVIAMARAGLRRGELAGLRREDVHFVADATMLGCAVAKRTCMCGGGPIPMVPGRSPAGLVRSLPMIFWCWLMTRTASSGRTAARPDGVTSCWSTCSASRSVHRYVRARSTNC
jgi:predicted trehalose synthase